jgi:hypothetical protein
MVGFLGMAAALVFATTAALAGEPSGPVNGCGCRRDESSGACYCDRKAKCGCPGECEPKGCAERLEKEHARDVQAETKKAEAAARQHRSTARDVQELRAEVASKKGRSRALTASERQTLERLLTLYVTEPPEAAQRTVDEVRAALTDTEAGRAH